MNILIYIFLLLFSINCFGNWSANYPTWEHPRNISMVTTDMFYAIREKAYAVNIVDSYTYYQTNGAVITTNSFPLAKPTFYRDERKNLVAFKNLMQTILSKNTFSPIDSANIGTSVGFLNITNESQLITTNLSSISRVNISNVLNRAKLPYNYLGYTPYRALAGLPDNLISNSYINNYTIDASTNILYTNNLPNTRTNWVSSDYGWNGLYSICNLLKFGNTASIRVNLSSVGNTANREGNSTRGFSGNTNYWAWQDTYCWNDYNALHYGAIDILFQCGVIKTLLKGSPDIRNEFIANRWGYHSQILPITSTNLYKKFVNIYQTYDLPCKVNDEETVASYTNNGGYYNWTYDSMGKAGTSDTLTYDISSSTYDITNNFYQGGELTTRPSVPSDPPSSTNENVTALGWRESYWKSFIIYDFEYKNP